MREDDEEDENANAEDNDDDELDTSDCSLDESDFSSSVSQFIAIFEKVLKSEEACIQFPILTCVIVGVYNRGFLRTFGLGIWR